MEAERQAPGAAVLQLVPGVRLLRPDEQVFTAMMEGWADQQLAQNLAKSRKLIAALLTAIGPAAERYAAKYFYRFSPEAIKELAQMDKTWGGIEQKCWRKYAELAASFPTPASIEKEIRDDIVVCGEELMLGPAASAGG